MSDQDVKYVRKGISKRLRFEVFKRDGFRCAYCGATPQEALLECDHVEPVSRGGLTEIDNLVTACINCNRGKSNVPLSDVPQSMAERAAETIEREAQIAGYQDALKQKRMRIDSEAREVIDAFCSWFTGIDGVPRADFTSMKMFVDRLGLDDCLDAVERATNKRPHSYYQAFKYFCGVCWGKIKDNEGA